MAEYNAKKKRKLNEDNNMSISELDDNSLHTLLLQISAKDHPNLRLSCQRVRQIIDSSIYREQRSKQGLAEVKVELLTPFEQYKRDEGYVDRDEDEDEDEDIKPPSREDEDFVNYYDDFGNIAESSDSYSFSTEHFRVFIDGRLLHENEFNLDVQFVKRQAPFYEECDIHSGDLVAIGCELFTDSGNPKVACLKNALRDDKRPLLYISKFKLPMEYRFASSTVGPLIIQALLKYFHDKYSLAVYVPDGYTQLSKDDDICNAEPILNPNMTNDAKKKRYKRLRALADQDMRQFIRAGFRKIDGNVANSEFQPPLFITANGGIQSILTEQQALDIVGNPLTPPEKGGLEKQLLHFITRKCGEYDVVAREIKTLGQSANAEERLTEEENKLDTLVSNVRKEIETLKSKHVESHCQVILDSNVIHSAAAHLNLTFIEILLEPFPAEQKTKVLNTLDENGLTALMLTAQTARISSLETGKCRQFLASFISMGADKDIVNTKTGLSALGYFRNSRHNAILSNSYRNSDTVVLYDREADQIETLLTPYKGATKADKVIIEADEEDSNEEIV